MKPRIALLVTDIDNTLFDAVRAWASAVRPMIERVAAHAGCTIEEAERTIAAVHGRWGATECPACIAVLMEDCWNQASRDEIIRAYEDAFLEARPVYDGVAETLTRIRRTGARVIAYSESPAPFAARRLALLGLERVLHALYAREPVPGWRPRAPWIADAHASAVPVAALKPNPTGLARILAEAGVSEADAVYLGDNLWKDVRMARLAGVRAVWARYGTARAPQDEARLARLCHWTPAETQAERRAEGVTPDVTIDHPAHLLAHFDFGSH